MILLDPDLDPDPTPKTTKAKRSGASAQSIASKTKSRDVALPSARALARFLSAAQAAVRLKGQVTVLLTTDAAIRKLNKQFRGKNKATDVLSFPALGIGAEGMAGDLAISVTTALEQAAEQGHPLSTEIKVLVLHGLLHLAGYDHEVDDGKMARRERVLRAKLKLPQGLIERVEGAGAKSPSGAKAPARLGGVNVRAKARTLQPRVPTLQPQAVSRVSKKRSSGAKAPAPLGGVNVRAKARTLQPQAHALPTRASGKAKRL